MNIKAHSITITSQHFDNNEYYTQHIHNQRKQTINMHLNFQNVCWFWGIQSIGFRTNKNVQFKTNVVVNNQSRNAIFSIDFDKEETLEIFDEITIGFILFEEQMDIYTDEIEFTSDQILRVDFGSTFTSIPKVILAIQEIDSSQLIYLDLQVVEIKKKFCKIKADFDNQFIHRVKVGVFAYSNEYDSDTITEKVKAINENTEMTVDEKKTQKQNLIQIQSDVITAKKSTVEQIRMKNYETIPQMISFITGFKGINRQSFPLESIILPFDLETFTMQILSSGNYSSTNHCYVLASPIRKINDQPQIIIVMNNNEMIQQNGNYNQKQDIEENIECNECNDLSKCCIVCKKHKINIILQCGHAVFCACCAQQNILPICCPKCNILSSKMISFNEIDESSEF